MTCRICEFADREGWWGREGTHCRGCHASWTSRSQIHCVQCHRQFNSDSALKRHQPLGTSCEDPAAMIYEKGPRSGDPVFVFSAPGNSSLPVWALNPSEALKSLRSRAS